MKIAYLVNQYPKPSHTFVKREVLAIEATGIEVRRFSIRRTTDKLSDPQDRVELAKTRAVLDAGILGLLTAMLGQAITRPAAFLRALKLTIKIARRAGRGRLKHLAYLAEACVLYRWLQRDGVSHIHSHFATNGTTVVMLCRVLGGPPYSFTIHGPTDFDYAIVLALDEKVAHAAFVAAISDFCRSQLFRWCAYEHWPKIRVVRCGIDANFLAAPPIPVGDAPRFVSVGRLCEAKAQPLMIDAAAALRDRGLDFELVLAGDGPMRPQLQQMIDCYGLKDRVKLAGLVTSDQVKQLILSSRAMLLPSFAEGLPVVLMEAMALGRPVVSTTIAAIGELVEDGVSGWLIPPSNLPRLIGAMGEVLAASPERLGEMGRAGAEKAREDHDITKIAAQLRDLFEQSARTGGQVAAPRPVAAAPRA